MGGTSQSNSSQSQTSQLAPYSPAAGPMNGILGSLGSLGNAAGSAGSLNAGQSGALNTILSNSNATPNYTGANAAGTYGLLNGGGANNNNGAITQNLSNLSSGILGQTATGGNIGGNSALQGQLGTIASDTANSVNGSFAAAGRDGSPGNSQALARGIAQGEAPVIAAQYNTDTGNALNAANTLYGAGNSTYGLLNSNQAAANTNFMNGVGSESNSVTGQNAAPSAALTAASAQWGIPVQQLQTLLGTISPVAQAFGTQTGTGTGTTTNQMSGAQQFATLATPIAKLFGG